VLEGDKVMIERKRFEREGNKNRSKTNKVPGSKEMEYTVCTMIAGLHPMECVPETQF